MVADMEVGDERFGASPRPAGPRSPGDARRPRGRAAGGQAPGLSDRRRGRGRRSPMRCARTTTRRSRRCWAKAGATSCPIVSTISAGAHALPRGLGRQPQGQRRRRQGHRRGRHDRLDPADSHRQGRCGMALRFGSRHRRAGRARDRPRRAGRHTDPARHRRRPARVRRDGSDEDRLAGLCPPAEEPAGKEGRALLAGQARRAARARWASWSPMHRMTASRRVAITATISACSTPRGRRRRAVRSTISWMVVC